MKTNRYAMILGALLITIIGLASLPGSHLAAQAVPVKNYFSRCAGTLPCDNILTLTGTWKIGSTAVSSTAAELNTNAGVTAGTVTASKHVVVDANSALAGLKLALGGGATTTAGLTVASLNDSTSTASGTVQSTEYTLNSVALPASAFNAATRGIRCVAWGLGAANANAKNIKFYFGGTAVVTLTGTTDSAKSYLAEITVLRSGLSAQTAYGSVTSDVGAPDAFATTTSLTETETGAITVALKTANTAAAAASATGQGLSCTFLN